MSGALDGIRVVDLTRYLPGPYCTMLLGDLGADVAKVEEPPVGDPTRVVPPAVGEQSATHAALNRNKRSIVVDLRSEAGAAVVKRLALKADVLVETFRPGVLARRGLGYESLREANPRLVYCSISGYGQDGPLAQRAGHDLDYAALGGLLGTSRDAAGRPVIPVTQLADMTGGLLGALGILAALMARQRTGRGQHVDASMYAGVLALMTVPATRLLAGGVLVGELAGTHACYNVYRCKDGRYLAVGALEPKFWVGLCEALGRPDLAGRQWERPEKAQATIEKIAAIFATRDRDDWLAELAKADVCVEPVLDLGEALAQPQAARSLIEQRLGEATLRTLGCPVRLSETAARTQRGAPGLGAHAAEILAEAGYRAAEVEELRRDGVLP